MKMISCFLATFFSLVSSPVFSSENVPTPCVNILSENKSWFLKDRMVKSRELISAASDEGVKAVRMNLFPQARGGGDREDSLDRWHLALKDLVSYANSMEIHVVIDFHESNLCSVNADLCVKVMREFWKRVSSEFSENKYDVSFEILNEPKGEISYKWSSIYPQMVAEIRKNDQIHPIIVGGKGYSTIWDLPVPDVRYENVIYTFHYYNPMSFTHQGADWLKAHPMLASRRNVAWGDYADRVRLRNDFNSIDGWLNRNDARVFLGEFGVFKRAPAAERIAWLRSVAAMSDDRKISWCAFDYEGGFGVKGRVKDIFR